MCIASTTTGRRETARDSAYAAADIVGLRRSDVITAVSSRIHQLSMTRRRKSAARDGKRAVAAASRALHHPPRRESAIRTSPSLRDFDFRRIASIPRAIARAFGRTIRYRFGILISADSPACIDLKKGSEA